jgi:HSP20 family protein
MERLTVEHGSPGWTPPSDVYETADRYVVTAEVPGLARERIQVAVDQGRLTIRGVRESDPAAQQFHQLERGRGEFARTFEFREAIAADRIAADLRDGVLTITLPKLDAAGTRRIEVT